MLFKETVDTGLLKLTQQLCAEEQLTDFVLVGGTALSLQIGHRKSIDIDLFSNKSFDTAPIIQLLESSYDYYNTALFTNSLFGRIGNIKLDLITHSYDWIRPVLNIENVRMASLEDIAAMKLNAIMGNGSRLKDYVDMAFLSSHFSLQQMLDCFETKYPRNNSLMALKSLGWLEDIDFEVEIKYMDPGMNWTVIERRIIAMVNEPQRLFEPMKGLNV